MDKGIHDDWSTRGSPDAEKANESAYASPAMPGKPRRSANEYKVITDLPAVLPVTEAELDLLEAELADFVAQLMKK